MAFRTGYFFIFLISSNGNVSGMASLWTDRPVRRWVKNGHMRSLDPLRERIPSATHMADARRIRLSAQLATILISDMYLVAQLILRATPDSQTENKHPSLRNDQEGPQKRKRRIFFVARLDNELHTYSPHIFFQRSKCTLGR